MSRLAAAREARGLSPKERWGWEPGLGAALHLGPTGSHRMATWDWQGQALLLRHVVWPSVPAWRWVGFQ